MTPTQPAILISITVFITAGIAALLWFLKFRKPKAPTETPEESIRIDQIFRDVERQIKKAFNGRLIATFPAVLVLGQKGSGKTSVIQSSGTSPELLAGQVAQGSGIFAPPALNIWLAQNVLFIEPAATLISDAKAFAALLKRLQPGSMQSAAQTRQAPRAVLLCLSEDLIQPSAQLDSVLAEARLASRTLTAISGTLGIQVPVYALVTKLDAVQGFAEFVAPLTNAETLATLGSTLRPFSSLGRGAYEQEMTRVVGEQFTEITYALAGHRAWLLPREEDRIRRAVAYQFPRDFEKLRKNLVPFLVEATKPSQLSASPFLRGFYFCGTRQIKLDRKVRALPTSPAHMGPLGATVVMSLEQLRSEMARSAEPASDPDSESTQWVFLQSFFPQVLLADASARAVSAVSTRTDRLRAAALAFAAALAIVLAAAFTTSYARNRGLEKELLRAALPEVTKQGITEVVPQLETLREPLQRLIDYRLHSPLGMQLGLFQGDDLLPLAQRIYCAELKQAVLANVTTLMSQRLDEFKKKPGDLSADFRLLKTFMMISTAPENADSSFLSAELTNYSEQLDPASAGRLAPLFPAVFRTYGELLRIPDARSSCLIIPAAGKIEDAQQFLRSLNANDRYQSLLHQASGGAEAINFNASFPNDAVSDEVVIPGWFTLRGWENVQRLLKHSEESLRTDAWVLGESRDLSTGELSDLAEKYRNRYVAEYRQAWSKYLELAKVMPYTNIQDAVHKLDQIAAANSVLLNLIALAAENTSVSEFNSSFQSTKAIAAGKDNFPAASDYLAQLGMLKNRLRKAGSSSGPAYDQDVQQVLNSATQANDAVDKISRLPGFKSESDNRLKTLLSLPITQIDGLLSRESADQVNGGGKNFCSSYHQIATKFPFAGASQEASWDDVERVFGASGSLAQFENSYLQDSLDCGGGSCVPKINPKNHIAPAFIGFLTSLHAWKRLLNAGSDNSIHLAFRAQPFNDMKRLDIYVDRDSFHLNPNSGEIFRLNWRPRPFQKLRVDGLFEGDTAPHNLVQSDEGSWVVFRWLSDAEGNSGGRDGFLWRPRSGQFGMQKRDNGKTMEYKVQVQADGVNLDRRLFEPKVCALPVVR